MPMVFPLFAVGDYRRPRGFEAFDRVANRFIETGIEIRIFAIPFFNRIGQARWPRNTANRLRRDSHRTLSLCDVQLADSAESDIRFAYITLSERMPISERYPVILLDMNSTFMFGEDRFGPQHD